MCYHKTCKGSLGCVKSRHKMSLVFIVGKNSPDAKVKSFRSHKARRSSPFHERLKWLRVCVLSDLWSSDADHEIQDSEWSDWTCQQLDVRPRSCRLHQEPRQSHLSRSQHSVRHCLVGTLSLICFASTVWVKKSSPPKKKKTFLQYFHLWWTCVL